MAAVAERLSFGGAASAQRDPQSDIAAFEADRGVQRQRSVFQDAQHIDLGRLLVGHFLIPNARGPRGRLSALALLGAGLLAAPQLLPTLILARDAELHGRAAGRIRRLHPQ